MVHPTTWEEAAQQAAGRILRLHPVPDRPDEELIACLERHIQTMRELEEPTPDIYEGIADDALTGYTRHTQDTRPEALRWIVSVIAAKQHDYGQDNITIEGHVGLRVRMHDKVARLKNLLRRGSAAKNESISDTWMDLIGYGIIGLMLLEGTFTLPLEVDQNSRS